MAGALQVEQPLKLGILSKPFILECVKGFLTNKAPTNAEINHCADRSPKVSSDSLRVELLVASGVPIRPVPLLRVFLLRVPESNFPGDSLSNSMDMIISTP